ncbi:MAG: S8 family serine peptidase [Prevotellaceae bacterium]|nr:S8 family serine peptidase [Prevotellaceae bacterium]
MERINMFSAWDFTMGSPNSIVAIIDFGTDWGHPDLGNGTDGYSNVDHANGWNYDTNNNNVITTNPHGTKVTGVCGAKANNGRGIAGISGGNNAPGITIIPYVADVADHAAAAMYDAVGKGARIINLSFETASATSIISAIAYAKLNNAVVVAASGNANSSTVSFPASHADVIAVGAVNTVSQRWSESSSRGSNYGANLNVVAPGVDILSTTLYNDYILDTGTSLAAPQVTGLAALILSVRPDFTNIQVRNAIESTCVKLSGYTFATNPSYPNGTWNNQVGHGLINSYAAINSVAPKIGGPDVIGASCQGVYTAPTGLPSGSAYVRWEVEPGITLLTGSTSSSCTVQRTANVSDSVRSVVRYVFTYGGKTYSVGRGIIARIEPVFAGMREGPTSPLVLAARVGYPIYFEAGLPSNERPLVQEYHWELTAGGLVYHFDGELTTSSHTFMAPGTYPLRLRVRDGCGWSRWLDIYVEVM